MSGTRGRRAVVLVIDACGVGALPDAGALRRRGHEHARARGARPSAASSCRRSARWPRLDHAGRRASRPRADPAIHGRLHPLGPGKDSITGHWELMGVRARARRCRPTPTAFRRSSIARLEAAMGHGADLQPPRQRARGDRGVRRRASAHGRADPLHLAGLRAAARRARRARARRRSSTAPARRRARR